MLPKLTSIDKFQIVFLCFWLHLMTGVIRFVVGLVVFWFFKIASSKPLIISWFSKTFFWQLHDALQLWRLLVGFVAICVPISAIFCVDSVCVATCVCRFPSQKSSSRCTLNWSSHERKFREPAFRSSFSNDVSAAVSSASLVINYNICNTIRSSVTSLQGLLLLVRRC